ncbi:beta-ketoacyl-[acyl-carrier-protein] synthase family protein [Chitinophaga sancti]|uniref:3-oxoacyl-[acyl-carrier-protein] synthase II n=1 Tax=Chitinophaga sancti TaxID=1004 RepID=A0A1K1RK24_9BACT|nr:beta-ketoacyl-[acyl-carrier-protein] synthase family protein [Chitinophaga sancti]WQD60790.1 beta-ketoacyl-[acyl-carrier-protein] synthase family protein [Chitinophaga sancti]WQG87082.1 beta-ketoacyl-[acyl-carrier-protein] synthase family protein [Chitinophaga sancti]SFW72527.1 3-oxoacyl-[acyl-carrier-protein] synthase II [Chitinophaga sancti]
MKKRVVVTGIGAISALGNNIAEMTESLENGSIKYNAIPSDRFSTAHKLFANNRGFMMDYDLYQSSWDKDVSIMSEVAVKCIREALESAHLSEDELHANNAGLIIGTSVGASFPILQRIRKSVQENEDDYELALYSTPKILGKIARAFKLNGYVSAISTACASGTNSIGRAFDLIENGKADIMISGGMDIFTELTYTGFNSLMAISKTKCKPFTKSRDGMSLGDGCAILILESLESAVERGATIYAEIKGYHILNEAYHATAPHPDGIYALKCMKSALAYGGMSTEDVDYINAHGTGTGKNDSAELKGCEALLHEKTTKTYVGSTKCLTGHTLGAAGSIEAIISILSMQHNALYANYEADDLPESEKIEFVTQNKNNIPLDTVLSNSFGFGGNMASILLTKYKN